MRFATKLDLRQTPARGHAAMAATRIACIGNKIEKCSRRPTPHLAALANLAIFPAALATPKGSWRQFSISPPSRCSTPRSSCWSFPSSDLGALSVLGSSSPCHRSLSNSSFNLPPLPLLSPLVSLCLGGSWFPPHSSFELRRSPYPCSSHATPYPLHLYAPLPSQLLAVPGSSTMARSALPPRARPAARTPPFEPILPGPPRLVCRCWHAAAPASPNQHRTSLCKE
jgi:hypothetical protein